jgi:S1/P1 Nuclease
MTMAVAPGPARPRIAGRALWVLLLGVAAAAPVRAWGPQGHQAVGRIAETLLQGSRAQRELRRILGDEGLGTAALWADCVKGVLEHPPLRYAENARYVECRVFQTASGEQEMVDYVSRNLSACHPTADEDACHRQYHYADIDIQRERYAPTEVGASDHDVVSAIVACIAVLRGRPAPAPFSITSQKQALRLLTHFVGDIHQPLHVGAVYLDDQGRAVDPDRAGYEALTQTRGGNRLLHGRRKLHAEWDAVPRALQTEGFITAAAPIAASVPVTPGAMERWSTAWADETLGVSRAAYANLSFSAGSSASGWSVVEPGGYAGRRAELQRVQLIKAGARLAQLLQALWP